MGDLAQEAAPYPRELVRTITLKDGFSAHLRPIRPDDEPRLVDLYERLSRHTAYRRFFTVLRLLPPDWYHVFANVDYVRRLALVAERETVAGVQLIGVGRYEPAEEPRSSWRTASRGAAWRHPAGRGAGGGRGAGDPALPRLRAGRQPPDATPARNPDPGRGPEDGGGRHRAAVPARPRWRHTSMIAGKMDRMMIAKITSEKLRRTTGMFPKR